MKTVATELRMAIFTFSCFIFHKILLCFFLSGLLSFDCEKSGCNLEDELKLFVTRLTKDGADDAGRVTAFTLLMSQSNSVTLMQINSKHLHL